ncbi:MULTISPECIES: hypothetical protein [unclassified Corynebacterium]|uniref:hypothetical protein n=1 Tax=unclassified Corynebacterium TaxID=2624378 RepID=UPI001EF50F07|nr:MULTISPECIES: hypothetical protein [unclassified Corynebacterium]MCG7288474.1 hypothetical protein [Corynebacterium sp. ACRPZ]MCG7293219.1 hypothetical protein [Corynebacterium sp. ACRPY]
MSRIDTIRKQDPLKAARFRNPRDTRRLIVLFFAGLVISFSCMAYQIAFGFNWWPNGLCLVSIAVSMCAWTLIRSANEMKDTAPEEHLDEYERVVLATWRKRSLTLFSTLVGVGGFGFLAAGLFLGDEFKLGLIAAGYFMLATLLIATSLPMVGYAITFNRKEEDK